MSILTDKNVVTFDLERVARGDLIRVRRAGEAARNGFVTKATEQALEIQYCNIQNNATSFMQISAAEASASLWEIWWSRDFGAVYQHPGG